MMRTNYRVIETSTNEYIDRWYGNADSDYINDCQTYGIPQEDYELLVREWGQETVDEMTEEFEPEKTYLVLDDCGTEIFEDAYTSAEDAFAAAERAFNRLTGHDIKRRTALYVLETVDPDSDSEHHLEGTVLRTCIRNGKAVEEAE